MATIKIEIDNKPFVKWKNRIMRSLRRIQRIALKRGIVLEVKDIKIP